MLALYSVQFSTFSSIQFLLWFQLNYTCVWFSLSNKLSKEKIVLCSKLFKMLTTICSTQTKYFGSQQN